MCSFSSSIPSKLTHPGALARANDGELVNDASQEETGSGSAVERLENDDDPETWNESDDDHERNVGRRDVNEFMNGKDMKR
uniref:Uncharacterized protein n=1 Tax=Globodera rostochiensis TaxID=31243 RepID=A0A914GU00_GLORO